MMFRKRFTGLLGLCATAIVFGSLVGAALAASRLTPTVSNFGPQIYDDAYADAINTEVSALWGYAAEPLGSVSGTNAITASATPALTVYSRKLFIIKPANANTGSVTLNINSVGARNWLTQAGAALAAGALDPNSFYVIHYDGSAFRMAFTTPSSAQPALPLNYLSGFGTANNASDANNDIDILAGQARDSTNAVNLIGGAMTKRLDAAWTAGNNNGGILQSANLSGTIAVSSSGTSVTGTGTAFSTDFAVGDVIQTSGGQARRITAVGSNTGMTITPAWSSGESGATFKRGGKAPSSIIKLFAIYRDSDGYIDYAASMRDTPSDLPTGYSKFRRIWFVPTDTSANNRAYFQDGDRFELVTSISEGSYSGGPTTVSSAAPGNVRAELVMTGTVTSGSSPGASTSGTAAIYSTNQTAAPAWLSLTAYGEEVSGSGQNRTVAAAITKSVRLSSAAQYVFSSSNLTATLSLTGWVDSRGRN